LGCYLYNIIDGSCWCDESGSYQPTTCKTSNSAISKKCIPIKDQILYASCVNYNYGVYGPTIKQLKPYTTYGCSSVSNNPYKTLVDMATDINYLGNDKKVPKGCSNFDIPNCKNYILQARPSPNSGNYDFICNECKEGAKKFSNLGGRLQLDPARPSLTSIGCPFDSSSLTNTCINMKLNTQK
jgi:hypothetical protein